jgi:hypothetical protein
MLSIYIGSLAFGGVLILASVLLGDGDTDTDMDFDADGDLAFDADADEGVMLALKDPSDAMVEAGTWLPFFSLRFWTFALASFGATGSLLHVLGVTGLLAGVVSAVLGMGIGTGAAWTFRQLQLTQVSGNVALRDMRGTEATVILAVGPGKTGKVRILMDGQHVDLIARTSCEDTMERNETTLVVSVDDGVANITPVPFGYQSQARKD